MRALLLSLLLPSLAAAEARVLKVWVNDVRVESGAVTNLTLEKVDVRFDEHGDLHITARGYSITPATPAVVTGKRWWIVCSPQQRVGAAQWDIDVFVNDKLVRTFRSRNPDPMVEITTLVRPGNNAVRFVARKEAGARVSTSDADAFELVIGDGALVSGQLELNRRLNYRVSAAQEGNQRVEMQLRAD